MRSLLFIIALFIALVPSQVDGYSVLAHEAAIDVTWDAGIRPLLLRRFPNTPADALMRARSFAYGGSVIQDLGFIGFRVATPVLERVFRETYGLDMKDIFGNEERAIATYRYSVSQIIPELTRAAWRDKHDEIVKLTPTMQRTGFVFTYGRREFEREYGREYRKRRLFARLVGVVYRLLPKIGPLKPLAFKTPTPEAEALFAASFRQASARFRASLGDASDGRLNLPNIDFDTGRPARHGEYALADDTYNELLERFEARKFEGMPPALKTNVLAFYGQRPVPTMFSRRDRKHWDRVERALATLRAARP